MYKKLTIFILLFPLSRLLFAQALELKAGYAYTPVYHSFMERSDIAAIQSHKNGQTGLAFTWFAGPVAIQLGYGFLFSQWDVQFNTGQSVVRERMRMHQHHIPFNVYGKIYADGKNNVALGGGIGMIVPGKYRSRGTLANGENFEANTNGRFKLNGYARLGLRYSRVLKPNWVFFVEPDINYRFVEAFETGSFGNGGSSYKNREVLYPFLPICVNLNLGIQYVFKYSIEKPFFRKREK